MVNMAKSSLLRPHFFHTLVPAFHSHLMIPEDFFSNYIEEGISVTTAELKSDASDVTWRVKMTGRRISEGWREFAVANNLRFGGVLLVRYEGDMVFHVSNLGQNCCEIQDISPPCSNIVKSDKTLLKKRLYPRTQVDIDEDDIELPRNKKLKMKSPEAEPVSSSDNSSFVALVTASSLRTDKLYLPQHVTSSNGLTRKCRKIVLVDGGERSWTLDLSFNKSSDTFYMSRGWRNFCEENGQEPGGFFMFKLVGNGETPVLSLGLTESNNDTRYCSQASERESLSTEVSSKEEYIQGESSEEDDCSSMDSLMETGKKNCGKIIKEENNREDDSKEETRSMEREKHHVRGRGSTSSSQKQFVTIKITPTSFIQCRLVLPAKFARENSMNKLRMIYLLGRDGRKWLTKVQQDKKGAVSLGKGWKDFAKANNFKSGDSFTMELVWEDGTCMLRLLGTEPGSRDSSSGVENRSVTLTLIPEDVRACKLHLPSEFMKANGIKRLGKITLMGENKMEWSAYLLTRDGTVALGNGWGDFCEANGVSLGESFTLEFSTPSVTK